MGDGGKLGAGPRLHRLTRIPTSIAASLLARLENSRFRFGDDWPQKKSDLIAQLDRVELRTAAQAMRLHEHCCFVVANPDNADVLEKAWTLLARFAHRPDLASQSDRLADSGIAGTDIHYRFFWPTAQWLAERWPERLHIDWDEVEDLAPLESALPIVVSPIEAAWLRVLKPSPKEALAQLARQSTDATFFVRAVSAMPGDGFTREAFYDSISLPLILRSGPGGPSRTLARYPKAKVEFRTAPPSEVRPDVWSELQRPPRSTRAVSANEGGQLIDLAREAMVTRGRDLDTFAYGDPRDVRVIDDGGGLSWVMIGLLPERRPVLRTAYGFLTLRNGIPVGYVQSDALWRCVDLAFNVFETFRGRGAAVLLGRTMAMLGHVFDATSFTLEPYQLGQGNDEGIESGAWWFYYKLGFRPRNRQIRALVTTELERMKRRPSHRSSTSTLTTLATDYLYFDRPTDRAPRWPRVAALGARVATWTAIADLLPGFEHWSDEEKSDLDEVIRAKAGRRDTDYLQLFNRHPKLGEALWSLTDA